MKREEGFVKMRGLVDCDGRMDKEPEPVGRNGGDIT
jgi:hypothetical protein